ncbi:hypothetical protein GCM10007301_37080 [Azorhizobium oxalatiphilum]|uniref:Methyltransferase domain-containing protein n=1 Tax=Azorhizobium oxalatiphilum TaxID=980631 RepID=A0A917C772_9HYPH|nr:class I SAM-dependent methyltransferase [Azorhizobium oxalatiphilum]GGF73854.1 hypothetical protein GCM10007301_37080 [Azorhizobium oxalatiphilum]
MTVIRTLASKVTIACAVSALSLNVAFAQSPQAPMQMAQAAAPAANKAFEPVSGQAGKDVVWVPTQQELVDRMLAMANVTKDDYVIDLGSGDGRTVITAARLGARAHGIEFNPDMVKLSQDAAKREGVTERASFEKADIFQSDFSKASVVTMFLLPQLNIKLRPTLLDMKPGTRIISNTFDMDDWHPDESLVLSTDCASFCRAYKWIIPAKVAGDWRVGGDELQLTQTYQMLSGTLTRGGKKLPISEAKMIGTQITFTVDGKRYTGEVGGGKMTGTAEGAGAWTAERSST